MLHFQRGERSDALALLREYEGSAETPEAPLDALAHRAACLGITGRDLPRARRLQQEADALVAELNASDRLSARARRIVGAAMAATKH